MLSNFSVNLHLSHKTNLLIDIQAVKTMDGFFPIRHLQSNDKQQIWYRSKIKSS
jgi:hypothetical protein